MHCLTTIRFLDSVGGWFMPLRLFHLGAPIHEAFWSRSLMPRRPLSNRSTADLQIHHFPFRPDPQRSPSVLVSCSRSLQGAYDPPVSLPITYASWPLRKGPCSQNLCPYCANAGCF